MALHRKSDKPAGITNASGQPLIELEIAGLKLAATPPKPGQPVTKKQQPAPDEEPASSNRSHTPQEP